MSALLLAIFCLFAILIFTVLILLVYSGLFHPLNIRTEAPPIGKCLFAYKTRKGPYKDCGDLFTEASLLGSDKPCVGIYYDDPEETPAAECRYAVGSILARDSQPPDVELMEKFSKAGFKCLELPEVDFAVHCVFPYRTTFSIFIAVYRVYSALRFYTQENQLSARPYLELYNDGNIHFFAPLSKQDAFYVDEFIDQPGTESSRSETPEAESRDEESEFEVIEKPN